MIFDLSAFAREKLERLMSCGLLALCQKRQVLVPHTPTFVVELLGGFTGQSFHEGSRLELKFALDICNGGLFEDRDEIFRDEIARGRGKNARVRMPARPNRFQVSENTVIERLRDVTRTGDISWFLDTSQALRQKAIFGQKNAKRTAIDMREEVAQGKSRLPRTKTSEIPESVFRASVRAERVRLGRQLILRENWRGAAGYADKWASMPDGYPFFTLFVDSILFQYFIAMMYPAEKIDINAQKDLEVLLYLSHADAVVSDDNKFFRSAFEMLWLPKGKRMFGSEEFAELCTRLSA